MAKKNTRNEIAKFYETETGLSANRGEARVDRLEKFLSDNGIGIGDVTVYNDTKKMSRDYRNGIAWSAGKQHGNTICLGYSSGNGYGNYKSAIFAKIKK